MSSFARLGETIGHSDRNALPEPQTVTFTPEGRVDALASLVTHNISNESARIDLLTRALGRHPDIKDALHARLPDLAKKLEEAAA